MPKPPTENCVHCGKPGWRLAKPEDLVRMGSESSVQMGMDSTTYIDRHGIFVCGGGEHLVQTRP